MKSLIGKLVSPNSTENLVTESESVLDVFTKTVTKLEGLNERIEKQSLKKQEEQLKIQGEIVRLGETKSRHLKVIGKIKSILE